MTDQEPDSITTHLRPDGTVFPPVTPDPPAPPGYVDPLAGTGGLDELTEPDNPDR